MEAHTSIPVALAQPHVVFMTAAGSEVFHRTRDCPQLETSDGQDVFAVGRASAQAVGRVPCPTCSGF